MPAKYSYSRELYVLTEDALCMGVRLHSSPHSAF